MSAHTILVIKATAERPVNSRTTAMALAIAAVAVLGACSGSATDPATTTQPLPTNLPTLEFGTGVLPATVPSNFPMPQPSVITTTMVDGTRELTEIAFNVGSDVDGAKVFFTASLPPLGYEAKEIPDGHGGVTIEFLGHGIEGTVTLTPAGQGVTTGTIVFVYSSAAS